MATERNRRPEPPRRGWRRPAPEVHVARRRRPQAGPVPRREVLTQGALAGLVAGAAMGLYLMIVSALIGWGLWNPLNAIGSTLAPFPDPPLYPDYLGSVWDQGRLPQLADFHPVQTVLGLLLHLAVSAGLGIVFASALTRFPQLPTGNDADGALVGTVGGIAVWAILGLVVATGVNRVMQLAPPPVAWSTSHVLFGIITVLLVRRWLPTTVRPITYAREDQADRVIPNEVPPA